MRPCLAIGAAMAAIVMLMAGLPVKAQIATPEQCARQADSADEIACLRRALEQSQRALADPTLADPANTEDISAPKAEPARRGEQPGAEQVAERRSGAEPVRAHVTDVQMGPRGMMLLRLDNGQFWRQVEQPDVPLRLGEGLHPVEIVRSGFGGYRLRFTELGRTIVVRRAD